MNSSFNLRHAEVLVIMKGEEVTTQLWFPKVELEIASDLDDYGYCDYDLGFESRLTPMVRTMNISGKALYDTEYNLIMEARQVGPKRQSPKIPRRKRG